MVSPLKNTLPNDALADDALSQSMDEPLLQVPSTLHLPSKSRRWRMNFLKGSKIFGMGLAGFASALVVWEGILRLAVESTQGSSDHPALGKIENPGIKLYSKEGFGRIRLNSLGMRGDEPTPKQANEFRILLLGDSFTRSDEVTDGLTFSDRLQAMFDSGEAVLNPEGKPSDISQVTVINAGKPGSSPASHLYAADFHKQTFSPDSIVFQISDHDFTQDIQTPKSEFYVESTGDDASGNYLVRRNESFGSSDPLAQVISEVSPSLMFLTQLSTLRVGGRNLSSSLSGGADAELDVEDAAPLSADTLAEEKSIQAEDAAVVRWVVKSLNQTFPNIVIVFVPSMAYWDAGETSSDPRNAAIEEALKEATAAEGVPLLNMRDDFLAHYSSVGSHVRGFNNTSPGLGHLNPTGHEIVAKRLADFYRQQSQFSEDSLPGNTTQADKTQGDK